MKRLAFVCFLGLVGCSNVLGLDDYTDAVEAGSDVGVLADAGDVKDVHVGDAMAEAANTKDVGAPDGPCVPTGAEVCADGIDNDCNGKTDCSDSACTVGFSCVPSAPFGWAYTAYASTTRPSCPGAYTTPTDVAEGIAAQPAACSCGCTFVAPTCATGNLKVTAGTSGLNGCQNAANQTQSAAAGCAALSPTLNTDDWKVNVTPPVPSGGSCAGAPSVVKPGLSYAALGRTCGFAGTIGGGCTGNDVCAPNAAPLSMCVVKSGNAACPAAFPYKHVAGSVVSDARGCTACTCALVASACGGTLTLYDDPQCSNQNAAPVAVDGACHLVAKRNYKRYTYTPQSTASCTSGVVSPTGGASFADERTICCVN